MKLLSINITLRTLFLIGISLLLFVFSSGCELFHDCSGCPKDIPWSEENAEYCYPDKDECEEEESIDKCYKCN